MFRSRLRPLKNNRAVAALTTTPTPATHMIVAPPICCGAASLWRASQARPPMTISKISALNSAARMVELRQP